MGLTQWKLCGAHRNLHLSVKELFPSTAAWAEGFPTVLVELKLMHSVHSPFHLDKASAVTTDILRDALPKLFLTQVVWLGKKRFILFWGKLVWILRKIGKTVF